MKVKSGSHMDIYLKQDGRPDRILTLPTYWDPTNKKWIGCLQTPSNRMMSFSGATNQEINDDFVWQLQSFICGDKELEDEVISMAVEVE